MPEPKPLAELSPQELADRIEITALDLNVFMRAGTLMGLEITADVVDLPDSVFPEHTTPEVIVRALVP